MGARCKRCFKEEGSTELPSGAWGLAGVTVTDELKADSDWDTHLEVVALKMSPEKLIPFQGDARGGGDSRHGKELIWQCRVPRNAQRGAWAVCAGAAAS